MHFYKYQLEVSESSQALDRLFWGEQRPQVRVWLNEGSTCVLCFMLPKALCTAARGRNGDGLLVCCNLFSLCAFGMKVHAARQVLENLDLFGV